MAKTKPIGVRFDLDMLEMMAEDKIADSPQKALNFLSQFWNERRDKIKFAEKFAHLTLKKNADEVKKNPKKEDAEEMSEELANKIIAIQTQPKPSFIDIKNFKAYKEKQIEELNKQYKNL